MARNAVTIDIDRPAAEVFRWLVEPERLVLWIGGYRGSEPLTDGAVRVGTRTLDTLEFEGRHYEVEVEVVALDPPQHLACRRSLPELFESQTVYGLSEDGGVTTVHLIQDTTYHHPTARLMAPLVTRRVQSRLEEDFARLKAELEAS